MERSKFTDEQIIGAIKQHDVGSKTPDVCRKLGISELTFYRWKSKFGGMEVSDAKRGRALIVVTRSAETIPPTLSDVHWYQGWVRVVAAFRVTAVCARARPVMLAPVSSEISV